MDAENGREMKGDLSTPSPALIDRLNFPAGRSCATWDARAQAAAGVVGWESFSGVWQGTTIYLSFIDCAVPGIFLCSIPCDSRVEERLI